VKLLDTKTLRFSSNGPGFLSLSCGREKNFPTVRCVSLFPISDPHRLISIQAARDESGRYEEVGILADLADLAPPYQRLVAEDIRYRYFVPEILHILKIAKKRGVESWRVVTDRGGKTFSVIDKHENIVMTDGGIIFIIDVDRFRYKITDYRALPAQSRGLLDKVLL
jgi:hypothetical protein